MTPNGTNFITTLASLAVFAVCAVYLFKQVRQISEKTLLPYLKVAIYCTIPLALVITAMLPKTNQLITLLVCITVLHIGYLLLLKGKSTSFKRSCYNTMGVSCGLCLTIGWGLFMFLPQNTFVKLIVYAFFSIPFWLPMLLILRREKKLQQKSHYDSARINKD